MRPIKKQPVSNLLDQLSSYHDLRYPVNLPEAEVYEYANDGVSQAGRYNPQAIQDLEDRRKQTLYERWMESDDDSLAEDLFELVDVTGAYSHDDFKAARERWRQSGRDLPSFSEFLDMVGAVPFIGTAKIPFKLLKGGKKVGDAIKVISSADYIKKILPLGEMLEAAGFLQDRTQE